MFRKCYMLPFWNNRNFESQLYPTRVQITCWWCIRMVGLPRVWTYCACLSIWKTFVEESTNIVLTSNNLNTKQTLSSKTRNYMIYICGNETWWKCEICCLFVFEVNDIQKLFLFLIFWNIKQSCTIDKHSVDLRITFRNP